ncbi:hypothetical protein QJQ45_023864, partial [Haematococcus lacustris]
ASSITLCGTYNDKMWQRVDLAWGNLIIGGDWRHPVFIPDGLDPVPPLGAHIAAFLAQCAKLIPKYAMSPPGPRRRALLERHKAIRAKLALMRNLDCPEVVRGGRLLQSLMNGRSDADPNPSLNSSRPAAEPDGTNGKATGSYTVRYQGRHILHKCAHRQHMGSAKLDLRGGLLAALVENAGSAGDAEEDNGLYTALFGMLCCLTGFQRPDLSVAAGQAIIDCFIAFKIEHNIKKGEVTVTVQHAKAAGKLAGEAATDLPLTGGPTPLQLLDTI